MRRNAKRLEMWKRLFAILIAGVMLFSNVSAKIGLSPAIVEKDFWVVWTLDYLFGRSPWEKLRSASTVRRGA